MDNEIKLKTNIIESINQIKSVLGENNDLIIREFDFNIKKSPLKLAVLFLSGLVEEKKLETLSLELSELKNSINNDNQKTFATFFNKDHDSLEPFFVKLKTSILCSSNAAEGSDYDALYSRILSGNTVVLLDGYDKFLALNTYGPEEREISEPTSQTIIRGPKDAFTENISVNISQIRKRIKDKSVKIENMQIGSITKTRVSVIYLDSIAKAEIINEIKSRLSQINIDGILDSGYIEELIKDDHHSVFPTLLNSEKPDSVVAGLLEGKVAIVVDGSPYVLTAPALFVDFLQVSEDYYHHYIVASMTRIFRIMSLFLTLLVPSMFIALTTFHHEMIPTPLLISIAAQREGVPFPSFVQAILMELVFEILREAGIRMPRAIGSAISIVGALVLGQAAVQAGFIAAIVVIIVSITAISSFAIPNYSMSNAIRYLRFILMILSAAFGLYGIFIGMIVLTLHLSKLKSIGVPYLSPIAPKIANENKDTFLRFPLWKLRYRPTTAAKTKEPRIMERPVISGKKQEQEFN